jgi:16S rRNA (adenine1518-N6/adenine1519-N6)-dimethyltransferase
LRDVIASHGLSARKDLGQNFLFDLNLTRRIARAGGAIEGINIIEVGPGPGGLTRALLEEGAKQVIAIERDARVLPILEQISAAFAGRLKFISGDALEIDYLELAKKPTRIIANQPYNIATPLLINWLTKGDWPPFFESMTLMFQKEVAMRICAEPGSKIYGRLSVLCGWRTEAHIAFDINPSAFTPPPKVTSSLVHLVPKPDARDVDVKALEDVTRAAFGQRRKMVRQSLKTLGVPVEDLLKGVGLKGTERAEVLPVSIFLDLAEQLIALRST